MDGGDRIFTAVVARQWPRRVSLAVGLILLIAVAAHWWWGESAQRRLAARVDALRRAGEPVMPEDFVGSRLADADNAAISFRQAAALIRRRDARWQRLRRVDLYGQLDESAIAALREAVMLHHQSLALAAEAAALPESDWGVRLDVDPPDQRLPDLQPARDLCRLLLSAAAVAHADADDAAMLKLLHQALALAHSIDQQPRALAHAVAIEIVSSAAGFAASRGPGLLREGGISDPARAELHRLIASLLNAAPQWEAQRRALLGERALRLHGIRRQLAGTLRVDSAATAAQEPPSSPLLRYGMKPLLLQDALLLLNHTAPLADAIDKARTWPAFQRLAPQAPKELAARSARHPAAGAFFGFDHRALQGQFQGLTDRRLAATALAIHLYRADHGGDFPAALEDLAPAYLPSVPDDPLASTGVLRYRRGGAGDNSPVVYSVGRNGVDDQGSDAPLKPGGFRDRWNAKDAVIYLLPME